MSRKEFYSTSNVVMHTCDKPKCVNPAHLRVGTTADNVRDRVNKKRGAFGERNYGARLKENDVYLVRALAKCGWCNDEIAKVFPVITASGIKQVVNRSSWKHIK